jgi:hypothetical protein
LLGDEEDLEAAVLLRRLGRLHQLGSGAKGDGAGASVASAGGQPVRAGTALGAVLGIEPVNAGGHLISDWG